MASRADLHALLEGIDLQCTEYFKAQHNALDRHQRKVVRAALQSMRDRLHANVGRHSFAVVSAPNRVGRSGRIS